MPHDLYFLVEKAVLYANGEIVRKKYAFRADVTRYHRVSYGEKYAQMHSCTIFSAMFVQPTCNISILLLHFFKKISIFV